MVVLVWAPVDVSRTMNGSAHTTILSILLILGP